MVEEIKMKDKVEEVEIDDELARFNDNLEYIGDNLDRLNQLFEHYLTYVLEIRPPNDLRQVRKTTSH